MTRQLKSRSALVAMVAAIGFVATVGLSAGHAESVPDLPPVRPERLISSSLLAIAARTPVSGIVTTHVDLGLPQLPGSLAVPGGPAQILLSDQTFKYWRSPDGVRVAQILPFAERDLVATPTDLWAWDSDAFTAWHVGPLAPATPPPPPSAGDLESIVAEMLHAAAPYAVVSLADPERVAGRDAYVLSLEPTDPTTRIGSVRVAIDAETWLPLRLQVVPKGSADPAIVAGFRSVEFGPVDPAIFAFTPPEGATVKELGSPDGGADACPPGCRAGGIPEVRSFGEGFGLILAVRMDTGDVPPDLGALLPYAGALGSADIVDRGDHAWVVAGAVSLDALAAIEPGLP